MPEIPADDSPAVSVSQCDVDEICQYDPRCPIFAEYCRRTMTTIERGQDSE